MSNAQQSNVIGHFLLLQGFKNHVKLSHNMWDYVYYSQYLDSIDTGDHTAMQKYVYELVSAACYGTIIIQSCYY